MSERLAVGSNKNPPTFVPDNQELSKRNLRDKGRVASFSSFYTIMSHSHACCTIAPVASDYQPVGTFEKVGAEELPVYTVGPKVMKLIQLGEGSLFKGLLTNLWSWYRMPRRLLSSSTTFSACSKFCV